MQRKRIRLPRCRSAHSYADEAHIATHSHPCSWAYSTGRPCGDVAGTVVRQLQFAELLQSRLLVLEDAHTAGLLS